jgi:phosphoribosyl-ATP pyrophosphohydrolase/phosphoribosyl-AMP cyclohydrolase
VVRFDARGLVPVVVVDALTGEVRMVAYADEHALARTRETGLATFFSRSRSATWVKGETSGNTIGVRQVLLDCDADCALYVADPTGPSCHTGAPSCFFRDADGRDATGAPLLSRLARVVEARTADPAARSYTRSLLDGGAERIGAKLREEADELARAIDAETPERVASEAADVLFHLVVGLSSRGVAIRDVLSVLDRRFGTSGHDEKAARGRGEDD